MIAARAPAPTGHERCRGFFDLAPERRALNVRSRVLRRRDASLVRAMSVTKLLDQLQADLGPDERASREHRFFDAPPSTGSLRAFAGEQYMILRSGRGTFRHLAWRFVEPPAGHFFLGLSRGKDPALERLLALAGSLGYDQDGLAAYEPSPGCHAYASFVAWLALHGSRAEVALALLANLPAWGESCRRLADLSRGSCDTSFLEFFAEPAPAFAEQAIAVARQGLAAGDRPERVARAARMLRAYELMFWDTLAADAF